PPAPTISSASHSNCSRLRLSSGSATNPSSTCAAPSLRSFRQTAIRGVEGSRGSRYASNTHVAPACIESVTTVSTLSLSSWRQRRRTWASNHGGRRASNFTPRCIGGLCAGNAKQLRVYVNGTYVRGDPRRLVLQAHQEIVVDYGAPAQLPKPIPTSYNFPPGL